MRGRERPPLTARGARRTSQAEWVDPFELLPVLAGEAACFTPGTPVLERAEAISAARAVTFDRSPAVELTITPALRSLILGAFASVDPDEPASAGNGLVIVVEVDGAVVSAPLLAQPSRSETRLIISGGFSAESARALAAVLDA